MTAPKPEAPTLDEQILQNQLAEAERRAAGRPEPVQRYKHLGDRMTNADGTEALFLCNNLEYVWASDYDALRLSHQHLQDRLNRMEAAMKKIAEWGCDEAEKYDGKCAGDIVRLAQSALLAKVEGRE